MSRGLVSIVTHGAKLTGLGRRGMHYVDRAREGKEPYVPRINTAHAVSTRVTRDHHR